jgi:hypothetical protein
LALAVVALNGCGPAGVNGGVNVPRGATVEAATTVNGGVKVGDGAKVGEAATVNGGVRLGDNVTADSAKTVNGGIRIGSNTKVAHDAQTVNGGVQLGKNANVGGEVRTVNRDIRLDAAHVQRHATFNGDIEVGTGSRVEGGIRVKASFPWAWVTTIPRIVIGPAPWSKALGSSSATWSCMERQREDRRGGRATAQNVFGDSPDADGSPGLGPQRRRPRWVGLKRNSERLAAAAGRPGA